MKLIVGLGNPGKEYEKTRHNVGFMVIDEIANHYGISVDKSKFSGLYGEVNIDNEKVILLKPQKYMNLSGEVIKKYLKYFKIEIQDMLIISDDMDLEVGKYKLKYKGGSAGHNGLGNIELLLKTNEYNRLKIGISRNTKIDSADYVLGKFKKEEEKAILEIVNQGPTIINDFVTLSFDKLMNKYNNPDA